MNIQSLWGISSYDQYALDKKGIKARADDAALSYKSKTSVGGNTDPAKIAYAPVVTGKTITNTTTANTLWQTQNFAQSSDADAVDVEEAPAEKVAIKEKSAAEKFLEHMSKSPEELMREEVLRSLGYTEEELAALDPKERAKIEEKIKDLIETKVEEALREKGINIDSANSIALEIV